MKIAKDQQVRLIATDMDGTLLTERETVSPANAEAILEAQARGIQVVVATGRSYLEAVDLLHDAGISCPIICVNGAEIRSEAGEKLSSAPLDRKRYNDVEQILLAEDVYYEVYMSSGHYSTDRERGIETMYTLGKQMFVTLAPDQLRTRIIDRFTDGELSIIDSFDEVIEKPGEEIYKLVAFIKEQELLDQLHDRLVKLDRLAVSSSGVLNLEVTDEGAQKGVALAEYARTCNIPLEQTMAIGDQGNDLSMMRIVGHSVAMGNAVDMVKQICSYTTKHHNEDGVAYAIRMIALGQAK